MNSLSLKHAIPTIYKVAATLQLETKVKVKYAIGILCLISVNIYSVSLMICASNVLMSSRRFCLPSSILLIVAKCVGHNIIVHKCVHTAQIQVHSLFIIPSY